MADSKSAPFVHSQGQGQPSSNSEPTTELPVREALIGEALSCVLLPDLTRIICRYLRRPGHRFDKRTAPELTVVLESGGARSFIIVSVPWPPVESAAVWSRHTLATGASRWAMTLPTGVSVWPGVADVREVRDPPTAAPKDRLFVGDFQFAEVFAHSCMEAVPEHVREAVSAEVAFRRTRWDPSKPTVSCSAHTTRPLAL
jgi:hypothetical protein